MVSASHKKILIISHDASQTGAPILLLNLVKVLKENGYTFHCIIKNGFGSLINQFSHASESCIIYNKPFKKTFLNKYKSRLDKRTTRKKIKSLLSGVDFVISNTITNGDILPFIKEHCKAPVISYVHELKMATDYFSKDKYVQQVVQLSDHFLVPSYSVKCFLQNTYSITDKKISVINSYIPSIKPADIHDKEGFKKENKIHASFIVGSVGTTDWRKSPDIFIQVAVHALKMQPEAEIQFIWKGAKKNSLEYKRLLYDIEKLQLTGKILLLEHSEEVSVFYSSIDLFVLTSREDPYPLVVLEAAANKVPSVCFSDAGGAAEFIEADAGAVVEYLNIISMAKQLLNYYNDRELILKHGSTAFEKVRKLHQDKELILEQIETAFNSLSPSF